VQGAEDDVISDPNGKKPAGPIEAIEHKHATKKGENPDDWDEPKFEGTRSDALSGGRISQRQQAGKKRNAAEGYEYPADDRD